MLFLFLCFIGTETVLFPPRGNKCSIWFLIIFSHLLSEAPGQEIVVSATITNIVFIDVYNDLKTPQSQILIIRLRSILIPYCRARFFRFVDITIVRLFRGSLGVDFNMVFRPSTNVTNTTVVQEFLKDNATDQLQFLRLGKISAAEATPTTLPTSISTTPTGMLRCCYC